MKNKKTSYIWILIVLEIINIPLVIVSLLDKSYTGNLALWYMASSLNLIGLLITLVWLHRAFLLKKDLVKWTNINFGFGLFILVFSSISIFINSGDLVAAISENSFMIVFFVIIWITFIKHLQKVISKNELVLN